ncbi:MULTISPECIES: type II toxin-antitoxin system RelE/ParE family toxin [Inquilinus]|uniref:Toxin ParE1/3/4 n=1 Tax=Inquilinus ginsengisoli TaxID=363840 RepID=A0ABU1K1J5_9PROT|nr:type II toxin-antitoxin system RelE/ParE family toxin [Inquilinus ginsengisoli]MDR6293700.1 toxin ParE1/3/4 [Inquilinus ginsengisoli]
MRLVFAEPAERDLDSIIDYIALDNPAAAERVYRAIVAATERLARFPEIGRAGRLPDTRELTVTGLPYLVVYQASADVVTILAVFHGARDLALALAERKAGLKPPDQ